MYIRSDWFGIVNGQISSIFDSYLPATHPYFCFRMITWVNMNWFSPNLVCAAILWRSCLGLLMIKFCQFLTVICPPNVHIFCFQMITWVNINRYSPDLVCALILWRSGLGLLMGKFCHVLCFYFYRGEKFCIFCLLSYRPRPFWKGFNFRKEISLIILIF